jgi:hypothetical protein
MNEGSETRISEIPRPELESQLHRFLPYVVLLLGLLFYLTTIRPGHRAGDFAMYLQHAVNLVEGAPYTETTYFQNPDAVSVGTLSYPPGTPLAITPLYALFGYDLVPMKVVMIFSFFAALLLFGLNTRRLLGWPFLALMLADLVFIPFLWEFKDNVESDFLFLFPVMLVLFLLARREHHRPPEGDQFNLVEGVGLGLLIYVAISIRPVGVVLLVVMLLQDLLRSRRLIPSLGFWVPALAAVALLVVQSILLPTDSGTYGQAFLQRVSQPGKLIGSVILNAKYYILAMAGRTLMTNGHGTAWADGMLLLTLGPFLVGMWNRVRHHFGVLEIFTIVYAGVLMIWPFRQPNYLIPLIPLLSYYVFSGLDWLTRSWPTVRRMSFAAVVVLIIAATYIPRYQTLSFSRIPHDVMSEASFEFYEYVRARVEPEEAIITRLPREVALFTGRPTTPPRHPEEHDDRYSDPEVEEILDHAAKSNITLVAAGPRGFGYHIEILALWNLLDERPDLFEPIWENDEWRLVRLR